MKIHSNSHNWVPVIASSHVVLWNEVHESPLVIVVNIRYCWLQARAIKLLATLFVSDSAKVSGQVLQLESQNPQLNDLNV